MSEAQKTGVQRAIDAAGGKSELASRWNVTYQAIDKFDRQGFFPLDRAQRAAADFDIPLRDLVRADLRAAMDSQR